MSVRVSVIMPSLNVGRYIEQCINSVTDQSLKDMEIICVDAGSRDGTLEILEKAAGADPRIKIIHSDIKSYGYQMNLGLKAASGEYIGIIETDDYAEPLMFETLVNTAVRDDLDAVKSNFWFYYSVPEEKNTLFRIPGRFTKKGVFSPLDGSAGPKEMAEFFNIKPSIWSAIYKRSFLDENGICFNETPGASYQDAGFNFKVWACAGRVRLIPDAFLHYRQDNEQSSVNSPSKVYCVCDEYREMERFITERFGEDREKKDKLLALMTRLKYDSYSWNLERLDKSLKTEFAQAAGTELAGDLEKGYAKKEYFPAFKWEGLNLWAEDPGEFAKEIERQNNRSVLMKAVDKIGRMLKK